MAEHLRKGLKHDFVRHIINRVSDLKLGLSIPPQDVRLIPGLHDPYTWDFPSDKQHLFQKQLSKQCIGVYKEICSELDNTIVAFPKLPKDFPGQKSPAHDPQDTTNIYQSGVQPAKSFTARIEELSSQIDKSESDLAHWRILALEAQRLNSDLETGLEVANNKIEALEGNQVQLSEQCRQLSSALDFYRTKATRGVTAIKQISGAIHSAKALVPSLEEHEFESM